MSKLPGRLQSALDELEMDSNQKTKLKKFIADMGETLPEHPSPEEVKRIIKGAIKQLELGGKKADKEEEPKEEKPKKEKKDEKEEVKESRMSFKQFLSETNGPKLTAKDGELYLNGRLLIVHYRGGDVDTIAWPFKKDDEKNLKAALYDSREMGDVDGNTVTLPNGKPFSF